MTVVKRELDLNLARLQTEDFPQQQVWTRSSGREESPLQPSQAGHNHWAFYQRINLRISWKSKMMTVDDDVNDMLNRATNLGLSCWKVQTRPSLVVQPSILLGGCVQKKTIINQSDNLCLLTALPLSWFTSVPIYANYPVPTHVLTGLTLGQHWELGWAKLWSSSNFAGKSSSQLVRLTSDNLVLICYFECLDINQIVAPPHVWTLWWQAQVDTLPTCTLHLFFFLF